MIRQKSGYDWLVLAAAVMMAALVVLFVLHALQHGG
jgi:ABC-type glycerol-3-phosphate transport system permease component